MKDYYGISEAEFEGKIVKKRLKKLGKLLDKRVKLAFPKKKKPKTKLEKKLANKIREGEGWEEKFEKEMRKYDPNHLGFGGGICIICAVIDVAKSFISNLLSQKEKEIKEEYKGQTKRIVYQQGYEEGFEEASKQKRVAQKAYLDLKEELGKKIEGMKKGKIPWQALRFGDSCPKCGVEMNREWIDNECREIKDEALFDVQKLLKERK